MKISWKIALCAFLLAGCAATRQSTLVECFREPALARGVKDGSSGRKANISFLRTCTSDSHAAAVAAYREGYASSRPKRKEAVEAVEVTEEIDEDVADEAPAAPSVLPTPVREPSAVSWVCEIEANSRVFTGAGTTRDEALGSARATCGSHFQASYCTKADCKQSL